ncbi:MAG: hypothetical protein R2911_30075 [Caldilineaceae bacterium]
MGAQAIEHLLEWGGMPALLPLPDAERRKWLQSYDTAYLERDLTDLARLNDLMPFRQIQRLWRCARANSFPIRNWRVTLV